MIVSIYVRSAEAAYFKTFLPGLSDPLPPGSIGLTAQMDNEFAGTALAISHPRSGVGSISVLHVAESLRNRGVGERLLYEAERLLLETGCRTARVTLTQRKGEPCLEKEFLRKRGYVSESIQSRSYTFHSADKRTGSWLKTLHLPEGSELLPLLSATEAERAQLQKIAASQPEELHPFVEERLLHPEFSTLLKIDGQVVGWLGIQQMASNLLLLRSIYVKRGYGVNSNGLALFAEVNRRQRLLERFAYHMLSVSGDNKELLRVVDRKLTPYASKIKTIIRLEKRL